LSSLTALSGNDLDAYLARIGHEGPLAPTADTLAALHLAHATHIPFENLDILLGRPIRLDGESLVAKLVRGGRGGYCFEQNLLFASVLAGLNFDVTLLAARVRYRTARTLPRTHTLLAVVAGNTRFLADVGFGGEGLLLPLPMQPDTTSRQYAWSYRLRAEGTSLVLQSATDGGWDDLYAFTQEPQLPVDLEVANHYVSTHPQSRFVRTLAAQLPGLQERRTLRNRTYIVDRGRATESSTLDSDEAILGVLSREFRLAFPAGTRFTFDETFPA
jgi:N-hydroxyarylamine O-acetyltransferase